MPSQVLPLILMYIVYGSYIAFVASRDEVKPWYIFVLILSLPFTYYVTSLGNVDISLEGDDSLDEAWRFMEESKLGNITSESGSYQWKGSYKGQIAKETSKRQLYQIVDYPDEEEESFEFKPKSPKFYDENPSLMTKLSDLLFKTWELLESPWDKLFSYIFPESWPGLTFIMIVAFCFLICNIQIQLAEQVIVQLKLDADFLALTFYNCFSNMPDLLTVIAAAKVKEFNLIMATLFVSQIINLQVALAFPWFMRQILFKDSSTASPEELWRPMILCITILSTIAVMLSVANFQLTKPLAFSMIGLYAAYVQFNYLHIH